MATTRKSLHQDFLACLAVGVLTTLVCFLVVFLIVLFLAIDYRAGVVVACVLAVGFCCYVLTVCFCFFVSGVMSKEFFTYLVVGGFTAFIYFGFIALSVEFFKFDYRVGVSIAYVFAVSFHFLVNRKVTFRVDGNSLLQQSLRYSGVLVVNYLITIGIVSFFVGSQGVSTYLSAAISIVVTVGVGYIASKFWVFRSRELLCN